MLENFALNLAAGCTQWFIQFSVARLNRRLNDPLTTALRKVYYVAFQSLAHSVVSDLEQYVGRLAEEDEQRICQIFEEYLRLTEVNQMLLEMSRTRMASVHDELATFFDRVNGPEKLLTVVRSAGGSENPVRLARALKRFSETLQSEIEVEIVRRDSELRNWRLLQTEYSIAESLGRIEATVATIQAYQQGQENLAQDIKLTKLPDKVGQYTPDKNHLAGDVSPWYVPFDRILAFLGREDDLQRLHVVVSDRTTEPGQVETGSRPVGVTGMGGIGKTRLVVEYAYRHREDYRGGVFWLNAAGDWRAEFAALGLYLNPGQTAGAQDTQIQAVVEYLNANTNSLLILDNVEDPQQLRQAVTGFLVPSALPCDVLFTTRRRDFDSFRLVELDVLPEDPGLQLLLRHPSRKAALAPEHPEHGEAVAIYEILGGLPLALEIAGAHLTRRLVVSLTTYRHELLQRGALAVVDDQRGGVRSVDLGTRHTAAVTATLVEQWDRLSGDAQLLLRVAGQLPVAAKAPLARLGLLGGLADNNSSFFGTALVDAATELMTASLMESLRGDQVRLHPLVCAFAVHQTQTQERDGFRWYCGSRLIVAYDNLALLEDHCARRGIDAVEQDLHVALDLLGDVNGSSMAASASMLLRKLGQESHALRGWDARKAPAFFRQQWLKRALLTSGDKGAVQERTFLRQMSGPHFEVLWTTAQTATSLVRILVGHAGRVWAVAVTPDGHHAISGAGDNTLRLWNLATGETVRTLIGHSGWVWAVTITSDSRYAVSGSDDGALRVWDLATGETVHNLIGHTGKVRAVAVTPDGRYAISGSDDMTLRVWDLSTGNSVYTLTGHTYEVRSVAVTPDSCYAISGAGDCTLRIWDLSTGIATHTMTGHTGKVRAVSVTPDGRYAISGSEDRTVRVWDLGTGETLRSTEYRGWVSGIAVTADGRYVISSSSDNTIYIWSFQGDSTTQILGKHAGPVNAVAVTQDCHHVISASDDRSLRVWELYTDSTMQPFSGHFHRVWAVAVTANGHLAVSGSGDNTLRVWDLINGKVLYNLSKHDNVVCAAALTADGHLAVSGSGDNTLRVWDLSTGTSLRTLIGHAGWVWAVALTPDGRQVVSGSADNTLRLWDLDSGKCVRTFSGHAESVNAVVVTSNGRYAISGSEDNTLRMWDLLNRECVRIFKGHTNSVSALAVSPDGRYVVSGSEDKTLRLWDLLTGECMRTFSGHTGRVWALAVTPDGGSIVSASADTTLRIWDLATGKEEAQIVLDVPLYCVAVSTRRTVVAGDAAGNFWCLEYKEHDP